MSSLKTKNKKQHAKNMELALTLVKKAHNILKHEFNNPNRVKLTHFWLAEKLGVKNQVAYVLLSHLARKRINFCVQLPHGPIFWENESVPVGIVFDAVAAAKTKARRVEQKALEALGA